MIEQQKLSSRELFCRSRRDEKHTDMSIFIRDTKIYIESFLSNDLVNLIILLETQEKTQKILDIFAELIQFVDYTSVNLNLDPYCCYARIIDTTNIGKIPLPILNRSLHDVARMQGNLVFDIKNFENKTSQSQKDKVHSDIHILLEIIQYYSIIKGFGIDKKIQFITNDKKLIREIILFKESLLSIFTTEYYLAISKNTQDDINCFFNTGIFELGSINLSSGVYEKII